MVLRRERRHGEFSNLSLQTLNPLYRYSKKEEPARVGRRGYEGLGS